MAEELKPCPFCGQSDFLIEQLDGCSSVVICQGMVDEHSACLARGPVAIQDDDGEEQPGKGAAIREWNTRAQLPSQSGEAVEVVGYMSSEGMDNGLIRRTRYKTYTTPVMTVAQHQRILAAATHPADQVADGVVVSRELLERAIQVLRQPDGGKNHAQRIDKRKAQEELRDCANECYNSARLRGTSGIDSCEHFTEQADALLAAPSVGSQGGDV